MNGGICPQDCPGSLLDNDRSGTAPVFGRRHILFSLAQKLAVEASGILQVITQLLGGLFDGSGFHFHPLTTPDGYFLVDKQIKDWHKAGLFLVCTLKIQQGERYMPLSR